MVENSDEHAVMACNLLCNCVENALKNENKNNILTYGAALAHIYYGIRCTDEELNNRSHSLLERVWEEVKPSEFVFNTYDWCKYSEIYVAIDMGHKGRVN